MRGTSALAKSFLSTRHRITNNQVSDGGGRRDPQDTDITNHQVDDGGGRGDGDGRSQALQKIAAKRPKTVTPPYYDRGEIDEEAVKLSKIKSIRLFQLKI